MNQSLRKWYFSLLKPRSFYLSDMNSSAAIDKMRIVDAEDGEYRGVPYRVETAVHERGSSLDPNTISLQALGNAAQEEKYHIGATFARMSLLRKERGQNSLLRYLHQVTQGGFCEQILTRPSYTKEIQWTYLILSGLAQDDLEENRLLAAEKWKHHSQRSYEDALHKPKYEGTTYELFLLGLAEERMRKTAERKMLLTQNGQSPLPIRNLSTDTDFRLDIEKIMYNSTFRFVDLPYRYHLVAGQAIPILAVSDFAHAHEAAADCINFALGDGQKILDGESSLLRHKPKMMSRLQFDLVERLLSFGYMRDFYVEVAKEDVLDRDIQIAPYFGRLSDGELEVFAQRLVPEELSLYPVSQRFDDDLGAIVISFEESPQEKNRILCYPSRRSLKQYNQKRKGLVRVVEDARSPALEGITRKIMAMKFSD